MGMVKIIKISLIIAVIQIAIAGANDEVILETKLINNLTVVVSWQINSITDIEEMTLYRSTSNLEYIDLATNEFPITKSLITTDNTKHLFIDSMLAENIIYYYQIAIVRKDGSSLYSNISSIIIPDLEANQIKNPSLYINKTYYFLELRNGSQTIKRYPIALGRDPVRRKLHTDYASTPEGIYKIYNMQPKAKYYKALDINYPNDIDWARYNFAKSKGLIPFRADTICTIGGSIQIHGMGIGKNWTIGCIAMRNDDIDELFNQSSLKCGVRVIITGDDISSEDIDYIAKQTAADILKYQNALKKLGYLTGNINGHINQQTRNAIGEFQLAQGLILTCEFDVATANRLLKDYNDIISH